MLARLNTQTAFIPFLSTHVGSNVLRSKEEDKQFVIRANYVGQPVQDRDIGIPMPTYAENVLPTVQGWQSVFFRERIPGLPGAVFDSIFNLKSGLETNIFFSPSQGAEYTNYAGQWIRSRNISNFAGKVTSAYSKLRSFVFYQRQRIIEYDYSSRAFRFVEFKGLDVRSIDGITAANNYLVAWNETSIFWSSTLDPLDFVPSLSSGAGTQNPNQVRGKIVACLPAADGFIIYTTANAIFAAWSGNIRFPWNFTEIPGSSGITSTEHVTSDANYSSHFAWTVDGLQQVSKSGAKPLFPELTDFITGKLVEEFIGITGMQSHHNEADPSFISEAQDWYERIPGPNLLQQIKLLEDPWVKLAFIGSRYFVFSYGYKIRGVYDWALVYDSALERWGKLRFSHVDAFNYITQSYEPFQVKDSIGFLRIDGSIATVDFAVEKKGLGVLLYGRLKEMQERWIQVTGVQLQTLQHELPAIVLIPTHDGVNPEEGEVPLLVIDTANYKQWASRISGANMNLLILGPFSISSLQLEFNVLGTR